MRFSGLLLAAVCVASCHPNDAADNTMNADAVTANLAVDDAPRIFCEAVRKRVTQEQCADLTMLKNDVRTGAAALNVPSPMTRGRPSEVTLVVDRRLLREIEAAEDLNFLPGDTGDGAVEPDNAVDAVDQDPDDVPDGNAVENAVEPVPPDGQMTTAAGPDEDPAMQTPNQVVAELPGEDHAFYARVGQYMKATLIGNGFDIRLIGPPGGVHEIPADGQGTWTWEVTPRGEGQLTLTALTEAVGKVDGIAVPLGNGRASKTVTVEVRTVDRILDWVLALPVWLKALASVVAAAAGLLGAWLGLRSRWRNRDK